MSDKYIKLTKETINQIDVDHEEYPIQGVYAWQDGFKYEGFFNRKGEILFLDKHQSNNTVTFNPLEKQGGDAPLIFNITKSFDLISACSIDEFASDHCGEEVDHLIIQEYGDLLKDKDLESLKNLPNLKTLEIFHCYGIQSLDILSELPSLNSLTISGMEKNQYVSIKDLKNLTHLYITEDPAEHMDLDFLSNLKNLTHLNLSWNRGISDISILENLTNLVQLNLSANSQLENIDVLAKLPQLRAVNITDTSVKNTEALGSMDNYNNHYKWHEEDSYYDGEWSDCRIEGDGIKVSESTLSQGNFKNGKIYGKGIEISKSRKKYEGNFGENEEGRYGKNGKGIFYYDDHPVLNKYEGELNVGESYDAERHGYGVLTLNDEREKQEGYFKTDYLHGEGVFSWKNGDKVEGTFSNNLFYKGKYVWADGESIDLDESDFLDNERQGEHKHRDIMIDEFCFNKYHNKIFFDIQFKPTLSIEIESFPSDEKSLEAIAARTNLAENYREIVDLKLKLRKKYIDNWQEKYELSTKEWLRDTFSVMCLDDDSNVRIAITKNPFLPQDLLIDMMKMEHVTFDEKLNILLNPSCSEELLKTFSKDTQNYSSSRLRKAVALHPSTPKEIVNKLLEDEYVWVREAAAKTSNLKKDKIKKILEKMDKKYPAIPRTYTIKSNGGYGIVEDIGGSISMDSVIEAIQSAEDSWSSYAYSNFYDWDDLWHSYGPTTLVDTVIYPDGTEEEIDVKGKFNYDQIGKIEIGGPPNTSEPFFHLASSWEKGDWTYYEFELVGEFKPECLTAIYNDEASIEMVEYYEYHNEEYDDDTDIQIEGEFNESRGSGVDIAFYVNTGNDGAQECDDFYDMTSEMEETGLDPESEKDIRAYLKKKYNLSSD
tara:strand:- start:304 stop:2949 length:2646 start_codon:yes stop_codon:yes gene_type:complete